MIREELLVIKEALLSEIEGHEFYTMAAKQSASEGAQSAYNELAEQELKHVHWVKALYESLEKDTLSSFDLEMLENPPSPKIFNWENPADPPSLDVAVYGIAIQMERLSVKWYKDAAAKTTIPVVKKLFETLAAWEEVHLEQFFSHYSELKEEWFNSQRFSPY